MTTATSLLCATHLHCPKPARWGGWHVQAIDGERHLDYNEEHSGIEACRVSGRERSTAERRPRWRREASDRVRVRVKVGVRVRVRVKVRERHRRGGDFNRRSTARFTLLFGSKAFMCMAAG